MRTLLYLQPSSVHKLAMISRPGEAEDAVACQLTKIQLAKRPDITRKSAAEVYASKR